ncbi:MAG: TolC family protein [Deltaproteobacteria bacterium]
MIKALLVVLALSAVVHSASAETLNLSLQEAKRLALQNNRDIEIERKTLQISLGEITKQRGAFDPAVNLSASYTDSTNPTASTFIQSGSVRSEDLFANGSISGILPTGTFYDALNFSIRRTETDSSVETLSPNWFTTLGFTVGQELLRNFGFDANLAQLRVARKSGEISVKELERRISDVLLDVETVYWNLAAAKKNLELAQTALDLARDLQRRNEIQVEVGTLPSVVVTQAKAEVAGRQVDVIRAENDLKAAEDRLKNILAIPLTEVVVPVDEPTTLIKRFDETASLEEALSKRAEIQQAKLDIQNRETLKKFSSNQRLPRLAVQGTVELQGLGGDANPSRVVFGDTPPQPISDQFDDSYRDSFRNLFEGEFPTWQILGILSFPIFNWSAKGDYIKASADLDRSAIAYKKVVDGVTLDVRNAIREVENSIRTIDAAMVAVELAEEVVKNEEERLRVGIGTTREVLEAQRDLVESRTQAIRAVADYNIALALLERAKGTTLQISGIIIDESPVAAYGGE